MQVHLESPDVEEKPQETRVEGKANHEPKHDAKPRKAKVSAKKPKIVSHSERVERVAQELGDLLDEHEAELKEVKDRVTQAISRTSSLRKTMKSALKEVSTNPFLEAELAELRKKFENLRNIVTG